MIRTASNLGMKILVLSSALYGTIQLCSYFKDVYNSHVTDKAKNPVVDTLDVAAKNAGDYMRKAGDAVSGSVDSCRPYLEPLEDRLIENGGEK